ncbi:MAG: methyl-accepting chemotaxis protein [Burkholderiales bacterium PBB6]|nr:MAG: methyl-accepting chemotaxis protein [Burkholderiales bacterium PBB6]
MQGANAAFNTAGLTLNGLVDNIETASRAASTDSARRNHQTGIVLGLVSLLMTAVAVAVAAVLQRKMMTDLRAATDVAAEVAKGNLAVTVQQDRDDEIGALQRSIAHMVTQLGDSLGTVRQVARTIGDAGNEIASGNQDLSSRTEQAASSLQQTASSMEELTATVRLSAQAATEANTLARTASEVAQRGGAAVGQVVTTMDEINLASRRISDIISVIDGIAFQTNILALNAAVEAARAGEQGRGFAVVAGEVRSLAGRSAAAAREIKTLINVSVEKVDNGARQVSEAGATMNEIVSSVERVTHIINEITVSANEQSQGIGQVNSAVGHLDQMTQQNAALVEQSAAAAESLKDQAQRLGEVVSRFRFGDDTAPVSSASPRKVASTSAAAHRPVSSGTAAVAPPKPVALRQLASQQTAKAASATAPRPTPSPAPSPVTSAAADADWETF